MTLTPRTALAVGAVALLALALPLAVVALLFAALAVTVAVDIALVRRQPDVVRSVSPIVVRGVPAELSLETTAAGRVRLRQPRPVDVEIEPGQADGRLGATLVARRRGRHVLPAPAIRSTGPLGLGAWTHRAGEPAALTVYPDLPGARRLAAAVRRGRLWEEGQRRGPIGIGTEFESVRDYLPDDDIRHVNWRAAARLGRPMSNQFRVERDRDVMCVVDCGRLMAAPAGAGTRLDAAIDAAVAVAAVAEELGDRCGVLAFAGAPLRAMAPRRRGTGAVLHALHDLEPVAVDSDYDGAFRRVAGSKRAFALVLTDVLDEAAARPLLAALPVLARRHTVALATVTDEELTELVHAEPGRKLDVYRAAVALDVLAARRRTVAQLHHAGADVIEAPAGALPAACVRAYLRAKSRGQL